MTNFLSMVTENTNVELSKHLSMLHLSNSETVAYHNLFGNISFLDSDLLNFLRHLTGSLTFTKVVRMVGKAIANDLYDAYFLVSSQNEEREVVDKMLKERAAQIPTGQFLGALQITSSNSCNYTCSYCFADTSDLRSPVREQISKQNPNITFELASQAITNVLNVAKKNGRDKIAIKFLGREPLVNWEVIEKLLDAFKDEQIVWAITTNGSLITDKIAQKLSQHEVLTIVSLDGLPETNDSLRTLKSGKGTYEITERGLKTLASNGVRFGVSSVISKKTKMESMEKFIDELVELGASELELNLVMQTNLYQIQSKTAKSSEIADNLFRLYKYGVNKLFLHGDWIDPYYRILNTRKFRSDGEVIRPIGAACTATSHQISVEPTGDVFPCRAMSTHYGNITNLNGILQSDEYKKVVMRTFYNVKACHSCQLEGFCQGTCLGSSEEQFGDIYQPPQEYCDIYRATTKLLLENCDKLASVGVK